MSEEEMGLVGRDPPDANGAIASARGDQVVRRIEGEAASGFVGQHRGCSGAVKVNPNESGGLRGGALGPDREMSVMAHGEIAVGGRQHPGRPGTQVEEDEARSLTAGQQAVATYEAQTIDAPTNSSPAPGTGPSTCIAPVSTFRTRTTFSSRGLLNGATAHRPPSPNATAALPCLLPGSSIVRGGPPSRGMT